MQLMRTGWIAERNRGDGERERRDTRERVDQLPGTGTLPWPLLLTIPDGVSREREKEIDRATGERARGYEASERRL